MAVTNYFYHIFCYEANPHRDGFLSENGRYFVKLFEHAHKCMGSVFQVGREDLLQYVIDVHFIYRIS